MAVPTHLADQEQSGEPTDDFLDKTCFFIYDLYHQDETADPEDIMLYFYPSEVTLQSRLYLQGTCSALINFAGSFTKKSVNVISLKKTRFAFKQIDAFSMILTSSTMEEETLSSQLESIYKAFKFYCGPFSDIFEQCREFDRKELLHKFKSFGDLLIPQLRHLHNNLLSSIDPLPYTELPRHNGNRFFLTASQILNHIKSDHRNLAGCLYYRRSVLCTHLDIDTTKCILNLVDVLKERAKRTKARSVDAPLIENVADTLRYSHPAFLSTRVLNTLRRDHGGLFRPTGAGPSSGHNKPHMPEYMTRPSSEGQYVGLYIMCLDKISIVILTDLYTIYDARHINKLKLCFPDLLELQQDLEKALKDSPASKYLVHGVSVKRQKGAGADGSSTIKQYNWLALDQITRSAMGTPPTQHQEVDRSFLRTSAEVHNMFKNDDDLTQVILRDHNGCVYGRRVLGREVYYQQFHNLKVHFEFMNRLEKTVRKRLKEDHNINTL